MVFLLFIPSDKSFVAMDGEKVPKFSLEDQFGTRIQSSSAKNKSLILIGCYPEDEKLCRKIARKIYWKIQTYSYGKEDHILCIGYLALEGKKKSSLQKELKFIQKKGYESIFLDWEGELKSGVQRNKVYVRGYHPKKGKVVEQYWLDADNQKVKAIYDLVSS
jgi:hypothetical protein